MRKTLAVAALCVAFTVALAGCGIFPKDFTERFNRSQQQDSIDKPYAQVIKERGYLHQKPIGTESVASGRRIIKHIGEFGEPQLSSKYGPYSEEEQVWRVVYFLVDADGTVKNWATLIHKAGKWRCWTNNCFRTFREPPVEKLDEVVRTSSGETIAVWRTGS